MSTDEIRALPPGLELDRLVALALGNTPSTNGKQEMWFKGFLCEMPYYSTDPACVGPLLGEIRRRGWSYELYDCCDDDNPSINCRADVGKESACGVNESHAVSLALVLAARAAEGGEG